MERFDYVSLTLTIDCRTPIDWNTPFGYTIASIEEYISLKYLFIFGSAALSLEIGCYIVMIEFIKDVKNDIRSVNEVAKSLRSTKLQDSIEFHTKIKGFALCICQVVGRFTSQCSNFHLNLFSNSDLFLIFRK